MALLVNDPLDPYVPTEPGFGSLAGGSLDLHNVVRLLATLAP
jgi:hypothetical protein